MLILFQEDHSALCMVQKRHIFPTSEDHVTPKYGGGSTMIWARFAALGPGPLAISEVKNEFPKYSLIVYQKPYRIIWVNLYQAKLGISWVTQHDNGTKHQSKFTTEWLQKNKILLSEWLSQSTQLNPKGMLRNDLKRAVHTRLSANVSEQKQF